MNNMNFTSEQNKFINDFVIEIRNGDAAIFAGAGLSASSGFVNWKDLLRDLADELHLDIDKEHDLIGVAQYYFNRHKRSKINNKIKNEFSTLTKGSENHKLLSRIGIETFWTTNYDQLIEKTLESDGKIVDRKVRNEDFSSNIKRKDAIIYKMHGDKDSPNEAILIKDDYETYQDKKELFSTALRGDLLSKTFLFIGFSFDDPNLEYILGRIKVLLKDNTPTHYCFFKKVNEKDYQEEKDFLYAKIKQELKIEDLRRYGINAIMVKEYSDITLILSEIERKLKLNNIFISGAAHSYEPFEKKEAIDFIHHLSYDLAKEGNKIISGYGLGIGSIVINGALEYKYNSEYKSLDDLLVLRPFPQIESGNISIKERWTGYRDEMTSKAGIAIFIFGNKWDEKENKVIDSDGIKEEFDLCIKNEVIPIPIGITGYISKLLWDEVTNNLDKYYPDNEELRKTITALGDSKEKGKIVENVIKIVKILQEK